MSAEEAKRAAGAQSSAEPESLAPVHDVRGAHRDERAGLLAVARPVLYAAGEAIVRQGQAGGSLFVVMRGEAAVTLAGTDGEVARLRAGDVFGEMSLLTGEPRTATVTGDTDCDLLEIDAEGFRRAVLANPGVLERITAVAATRREEMERHQEAHAMPAPAVDTRQSLLHRVRQFLRL